MAFTHLHVHTEYSLLDGACRIKDLVAAAKASGMDSLAITDHGVMFGVVDFWRECKKQGIRPILGCEVYVARRTRFDKDPMKDKGNYHLILLAENNTGYHNLMKIVSRGFTEGFYYKPKVDHELLKEYSEGIICLSACLAGEIPQALMNNDYEKAKRIVMEYKDIFGQDNYFLELQDQGLEEEMEILEDMKKLSKETNTPLVATNDVHYVRQEDAKAHDILLCIQTASVVSDENRMRFPNEQFYLKSEREMRTLFAAIPEAIDNTQKIAERCNVELEFGTLHLPEFIPPEGMTNTEYLESLCRKGLNERYPNHGRDIEERLEYELGVIKQMGYVEYFLIVWDFINYAKSQGIMVGPGRGSAAGSIVAYTLRITDIDPIKYNLIFERFLNPERVSMPDIDVDFCYERRGEVIDYVVEKYGADKVSQIITFGTMKARAAIRDVGRVLEVSYADTDKIAKAIPMELKMTIAKALEINPELRTMYDNDPVVKNVIDTAKALEGMPRHASTHAAGVVISKKAIDEYVPLYLADKGVATQFNMTTIEELGLLKMDFLGLRNLTVIRDALNMIEENHGVTIDFSKMDYDDHDVYKNIAKGNTQGIFQLESPGMTNFMKNLNPDCFEDIVAGISLYRPGPMGSIPTYIENKKNPDNIKYLHPLLEPILSVTYGCLVYQEQVMQIVRDLAGYTYGHSDILRRAMGKKKMDVMMAEKEVFLQGCEKNGVSRDIAEQIFNQMVTFAEYAFNKSHAAAYAVVGYETAYLKTHYPAEFMAALLTSVMGDGSAVAKYIRNCNEMGIEVLPPDINESEKKFSVKNGKIRYGLLGIKSAGENVIDAILETRKEKGPFTDIFHFINSQDISKMNKKTIESLIKAGAFDSMEPNRARYLAVYEELIESAHKEKKNTIEGQISLFDLAQDQMAETDISKNLPDVAPFTPEIISAMEKEMLGTYITSHPLKDYMDKIDKITSVNSEMLAHAVKDMEEKGDATVMDGEKVIVAGIIDAKKTLITKNNKMMAFVDLEDPYGMIEVVVFPNIYERYQKVVQEDKIVVVKGTLNFKEDENSKVLANEICLIDEYDAKKKDDRSYSNYGGRNSNSYSEQDKKNYQAANNAEFHGSNPPEGPCTNIVSTATIKNADKILKIKINLNQPEDETFIKIQGILKEYPGEIPVVLYNAKGKGFKAGKSLWIRKEKELLEKLIELVGEANVKI